MANQNYYFQEAFAPTLNVQHPSHAEVFADELDPLYFEPILSIDAGIADESLRGTVLHFIAMGVELPCCEFKLEEDGRYKVFEMEGSPVDDWEDFYEDLDGFEEEEEAFAEIERVENIEFRKPTEKEYRRPEEFPYELWLGEPRWLQSDESPGSDYIFIGQLECDYTLGTLYLFFDPKNRLAYQVIQCT